MILALTTIDPYTGEMRVPLAANVARAIKTAKDHGFLAAQSGSRCLVVPPHAISGGVVGSEHEVCRHHLVRS